MHRNHRKTARPIVPTVSTVSIASIIVLLGTLSLTGPGFARQPEVKQQTTLWDDDPPMADFFGGHVDALGDLIVAAGVEGFDSAQTIFEQQQDGTWARILTSGVANFGTRGRPVAMHGQSVFRIGPGAPSGLAIEEWSAGTSFTPIFSFGSDDASVIALEASSFVVGDIGAGFLIAVAYAEPLQFRLNGQPRKSDYDQTPEQRGDPLLAYQVVLFSNYSGSWNQVYGDSVIDTEAPSIDLSHNQLTIGWPGQEEVDIARRGSFTWSHFQTIPAPSTGIEFGSAVAGISTRVAVGAPQAETCQFPPNSLCTTHGQVYFYEAELQNQFQLTTTLAGPFDNIPAGAELGTSVELSLLGTRVAAGAPQWADNSRGGPSTIGKVMVAQEPDSGPLWIERWLAQTAPAQSDGLGAAVAIGEDGLLIAGAPGHFDGTRTPGAVLLFSADIFADGFESGGTLNWQ